MKVAVKWLGAMAFALSTALAQADVPQVVTSIKPLHSLVAQVMDGVGEPVLLVDAGSPHGYQLTPANVRAISEADILIWVSDDLEPFMAKTAKKAGSSAQPLIWQELPKVELLESREGGLWTDADDEHAHDEHAHGHDNPHLWLSTDNAAVLIKAVSEQLQQRDAQNQTRYADNAEKALANLTAIKQGLSAQLAPVQNIPYMVFHDAYPYFEHEFDLHPLGVVRVDPEHEPGLKDIAAIRAQLQQGGVVCLFSEPQFPSTLVSKLISGTSVKSGVLDPIGAELPPGGALYGQLLENLGENLNECLH